MIARLTALPGNSSVPKAAGSLRDTGSCPYPGQALVRFHRRLSEVTYLAVVPR